MYAPQTARVGERKQVATRVHYMYNISTYVGAHTLLLFTYVRIWVSQKYRTSCSARELTGGIDLILILRIRERDDNGCFSPNLSRDA